MPWKLREYECEDCGKLTRRNRKSNDPRVCIECGEDRRRNGWRAWSRPVSFVVDSDGEVMST